MFLAFGFTKCHPSYPNCRLPETKFKLRIPGTWIVQAFPGPLHDGDTLVARPHESFGALKVRHRQVRLTRKLFAQSPALRLFQVRTATWFHFTYFCELSRSHSRNNMSIHVSFDISVGLPEEMVYKLSLLAPLDHVTQTCLSCLLVSANSEANHGS